MCWLDVFCLLGDHWGGAAPLSGAARCACRQGSLRRAPLLALPSCGRVPLLSCVEGPRPCCLRVWCALDSAALTIFAPKSKSSTFPGHPVTGIPALSLSLLPCFPTRPALCTSAPAPTLCANPAQHVFRRSECVLLSPAPLSPANPRLQWSASASTPSSPVQASSSPPNSSSAPSAL